MFTCENGAQFTLDACISVTVLRPNEVQMLFDDDGITYYAKVYITDRQKKSLVCYNIIRRDYDRLLEVKMKKMFRCENGDLFSLDDCISFSVLRPDVVQQLLEDEGVTYYAKVYITDGQKNFLVSYNITCKDYDRLLEVYQDPRLGNCN